MLRRERRREKLTNGPVSVSPRCEILETKPFTFTVRLHQTGVWDSWDTEEEEEEEEPGVYVSYAHA